MNRYRTLLTGLLMLSGLTSSHVVADTPTTQPATQPSLSEPQKIERLIQSVADLKNAVFIRNDEEHSAAEAADHMRRKLKAAGDRVQTVEQFIENIASRSNATGKAYKIRFADGREVESAVFLREKLKELEGGK